MWTNLIVLAVVLFVIIPIYAIKKHYECKKQKLDTIRNGQIQQTIDKALTVIDKRQVQDTQRQADETTRQVEHIVKLIEKASRHKRQIGK